MPLASSLLSHGAPSFDETLVQFLVLDLFSGVGGAVYALSLEVPKRAFLQLPQEVAKNRTFWTGPEKVLFFRTFSKSSKKDDFLTKSSKNVKKF